MEMERAKKREREWQQEQAKAHARERDACGRDGMGEGTNIGSFYFHWMFLGNWVLLLNEALKWTQLDTRAIQRKNIFCHIWDLFKLLPLAAQLRLILFLGKCPDTFQYLSSRFSNFPSYLFTQGDKNIWKELWSNLGPLALQPTRSISPQPIKAQCFTPSCPVLDSRRSWNLPGGVA